jgi:stringent starvation protein B
MSEVGTSSQRPYLLRAMHEWMADNGLTPHIVVDAEAEGLQIPEGHVSDGKIVLNVSFAATRDLSLGNRLVCFEARFGGVPKQVAVPIDAVLGIYARETGQGMVFAEEKPTPPEPDDDTDSRSQKPSLRVVK